MSSVRRSLSRGAVPQHSLHGGDPSVLRRLNSAATLRALRDGGEATLSELARRVELSRPTTEGVLGGLIARGLVTEDAPRPGAGLGRPARRYRFRAGPATPSASTSTRTGCGCSSPTSPATSPAATAPS